MQPFKVLATRTIIKGTTKVSQILVQWENDLQEEVVQEDIKDIKASYPTFNLEDKINFKGEGNVINAKAREEMRGEKEESHVENIENNQLIKNMEMRRGKREKKAN